MFKAFNHLFLFTESLGKRYMEQDFEGVFLQTMQVEGILQDVRA